MATKKPKKPRPRARPKPKLETPEELLAKFEAGELKPHVGGSPLFRPEYVAQARKLYQKGWMDLEVADFFEISERTLYGWAAANTEFARVRKLGKDAADERVEKTLYKRALGYEQPSEKVFCSNGIVTRVQTREHIPGDVRAQRYILNNRRPQEWRERSELTGAGGTPLHPAGDAPKRPMIEIARRIVYALQRAEDEQNGGPQPLLIETKITATEG